MRLSRHLVAVVVAAALAAAGTTGVEAQTGVAPQAIPARTFAPYFESYTGQSPATLAQQSGAKFLTMAFLQTASPGSCTTVWDGDSGMPVSSSVFGSDFTTIRNNGGDVIPSYGGYGADHGGTELADSCTNVNSIASEYERVVTTYNVTRIDLDTEDASLTNSAGIDRRNKAIKLAEDWAVANGRTLQFSYTLPTTTGGLASSGLAVLQNAVSNNARIDIVNIMTFDYYDNAAHEMATDTQRAATGLHSQLASLYPGKSSAQLWAMTGVTEMIGVDDFGPAETFTTADATTVLNWANSTGIGFLSFWALQRDNGNCPGSPAADNCSSISQSQWFFTHTFAPFTSGGGGGGGGNDFSISLAPSSGSVAPGASTTATVSSAVTSGSAQSVALSASGAPSGVSVSFSPTSVNAGASSTMTVSTTSSAATGTFPITVTGAASSGSHTTSYQLTVGTSTPPPPGAIVNPGLESGALSPWTCQPGGGVANTPVHSGSWAVRVAPTNSQTGECDQTITLAANHSYTLKAWVTGNYAYVGVSGGASASTWASSATYTQLSVPFTTGSSGTVTVYVHGWYAQGNVYADDFSIA
ncbi:MAG TPA: glycosyl hydrolase family 18 protein [Jatrophihabitantaceae bacterium]|jgi:hypothetical protein